MGSELALLAALADETLRPKIRQYHPIQSQTAPKRRVGKVGQRALFDCVVQRVYDRPVPIRRALTVALTLVLLAGCGGSDNPTRSTPTATPTPNEDNRIFVNCPGFTPGATKIISGTPYVILAAACTPTATGGTPPLTPLPTASPIPLCYDIDGERSAGCPTPTSTPLAFGTTYRLTEGSTILSSPAPSGSSGPVLEEPLSGTFTIEPRPKWDAFCPNTNLCFAVTAIHFQSAHFTVRGSTGKITQSSFLCPADTILMSLIDTLINGQPFILNGGGPFDANANDPPTFRALEICGTPPGVGGDCAGVRAGADVGYDLMIFADPESGH